MFQIRKRILDGISLNIQKNEGVDARSLNIHTNEVE
jgi:hypothetical protein